MLFIRSLRSSLFLIGIFGGFPLTAQTFGGLKPSIRWSQINTDTVRIIFPEGLQPQAQRVANAIHYLYRHERNQIGDKAFKIDILLNNQTTISNGFVSIAPWKSNFATTPLQDNFQLTSLPWLDLLALHEYRHVIQMSTARRGLVNVLYYLFGEESWAGAANLSLPGWFTEGDAVWAETYQSAQGRGRIASFLEGYRALKFSQTKYPYRKVRNGSLKDYVPDHYRLGYLLVKYGADHYGEDFWRDILIDAASYKGVFYPFARSMKKNSGLSPSGMYDRMWKDLTGDQAGLRHERNEGSVIIPASEPQIFTDFQYPHLADDSTLIYFQRSYDQIGRFVSYDLKRKIEKPLLVRGISIDPYFGGNGNYLTWSEYSSDPRWSENDYSDIIQYHIRSGVRRRITHRQKYFSPQPSSDGRRIACVRVDETAHSSLVVIDGDQGRVLREYRHENWFFTYPRWSQDETSVISAVRNQKGAMALVRISLDTGEETVIVPFRNRILGIPEVYGDEVFYAASTEGMENIFATHQVTGATRQVTDELNGAFQPAVGSDSLYYVTFQKMGNVIKVVDRNRHQGESPALPFEFKISNGRNVPDSLPGVLYPVTRYNRLMHSLNPHTWGFNMEDPEITARILSNNVLNNVEVSAGISYNYDNQNYRPFARLSVATWYPIIDLEASSLKRSALIEGFNRDWTETNLYGGLSVDWNLYSKSYRRSISPSVGINQTRLNGDVNLTITSLTGLLTLKQLQIKARKNIFTHSGQYLQLRYNQAIDEYLAEQIQVRTGLAFRGLGINHNLIIEADMKKDVQEADYQFSNGLHHRGLGVIAGDEVYRISADYHLPVFYPDWGFGGLLYFFRVRINPFYEISFLRNADRERNYQSVGAELVFDMNAVNEVSFSLGLRYAYPLNSPVAPGFEIFVPVYRF
jgi:hypothetical protein